MSRVALSATWTPASAAELDVKIERTDELIDEIVYELYGLTDEEIEIVEDRDIAMMGCTNRC